MILYIVNSIVGRPGNYGSRIIPIIKNLNEDYFVFSRGIENSNIKGFSFGIFSHYSRVLNFLRIWFFNRWNHRALDIIIFQSIFSIWMIFNKKTLEKVRTVHLYEPSPKIIKKLKDIGIKVILDVPIAPSNYVINNKNNLPLFKYDNTKFENESYINSSLIFSPSDFVSNEIHKIDRFLKNKIVKIPFGVNHSYSNTKSSYSFENEFKIVFVGFASRRKGFHILLDAINTISKKYKIKLFVFGKVAPHISNILSNYDYEISFEGFSKDLLLKLSNYDLFILPSYLEGCSKAVLEAMSCGLPVICSYESGSVITHKFDGFILKNICQLEIANRISDLINNQKLRKKIGSNAVKTARQYSWDTYAKKCILNY